MNDCFDIFAAFLSFWMHVITIWAYFNGRKNNFLDLIITEKKLENMITAVISLPQSPGRVSFVEELHSVAVTSYLLKEPFSSGLSHYWLGRDKSQ